MTSVFERYCVIGVLFLVINVHTQDLLTQIKLEFANDCDSNSYFDISKLRCTLCPVNSTKFDLYNCYCNESFRYNSKPGGGGVVSCVACLSGEKQSPNGLECLQCDIQCQTCDKATSVLRESNGAYVCDKCPSNRRPVGQQCEPCFQSTFFQTYNGTGFDCQCDVEQGGICFKGYVPTAADTYRLNYLNDVSSWYLLQYAFPVYEQCRTRAIRNTSACQALANMCVLSIYSASLKSICQSYKDIGETSYWPENMPALPFSISYGTFKNLYSFLNALQIKLDFSTNNCSKAMEFYAARHALNGSLLSFGPLDLSELQLCNDYTKFGLKNTFISFNYQKSCSLKVKNLLEISNQGPVFYDLYFKYILPNGTQTIMPVPVIINNYVSIQPLNAATNTRGEISDATTIFRRFFLIDSISGQKTQGVVSQGDTIRYAKQMRLRFDLESGSTSGRIYPPVIVLDYDQVGASDELAQVNVAFEVYYRMSIDQQIIGIWIAFGILLFIGLIVSFVKTWIWNRRSGKITVDIITIFKFFMFVNEVLANIFFILLISISIWWLIFYKGQSVSYSFLPQTDQSAIFLALIIIPFILKIFDILHLVFTQVSYNIFMIDWERPKSEKRSDVSCWRTLFVANEWNEIQTFRKTNTSIQLVIVLFFLKVINLEALTTADCVSQVNRTSTNDYLPPYDRILRVGMASSMYILIGIFQWFIYVLIYARCVTDKLGSFVDFCSVSNISVFIMTHAQYGYYIHGKSPHGNSDTNMRQMAKALEKEKNDLVARRGLLPDNDHQTFSISIPSKLMKQYSKVMLAVNERLNESRLDKSLIAYKKLNDFFTSFVDHSLREIDYVVVSRNLFENLFDIEFKDPLIKGYFYQDEGYPFADALFAGHERSLFVFELSVFLFVDFFAINYVLAAFIAYIAHKIVNMLRNDIGKINLARKTLIDKRFLI